MNHKRLNQRGFAAIAAIFLVVVLAALGGFMVTFSNTQQLTSSQDVLGSRAYWAARGGLEWAFAWIVESSPVAPAVLPVPVCPVAAPPATIETFSMSVTCTASTFLENGQSRILFRIVSVASRGSVGSPGFIERSVTATMEWPTAQ